MKAVIPAAGIGKRLRPHTYTAPKAMISVAGRPILGHIIDSLLGMGVDELIPIIGYKGEMIREYIDQNYDVQVNYVVQQEQEGIAHAVSLTRDYADDSELIIILGDTIIEADFSKIPGQGDHVLGVREVDNPGRFGIVELSGGSITGIEEKPDQPKSNLAIVGLYYFRNSSPLYNACAKIIEKDIRTKGEYQLTDALALMLEEGMKFKPYTIDNWFDCGKIETLLDTNRILLDQNPGMAEEREGCLIIPPCWIGEDCELERSIIGPHVSISEGCRVANSIVENSILYRESVVRNAVLKDSVVGVRAECTGISGTVNLGDESAVVIKKQD
jgi:glucose-1-phosphate thymidylyltransferase